MALHDEKGKKQKSVLSYDSHHNNVTKEFPWMTYTYKLLLYTWLKRREK